MKLYAWINIVIFTSYSCINVAAQEKPILVWTSSSAKLRVTAVYSAPALKRHQHTLGNRVISGKIASLRYPHYLASVSSNDVTHEVTAVDIGRGNIVSFNSADRSIVRHHGGVSRGVGGIAIDWTTGNIYWTDEERHWIIVSKWNLSRLIPIITEVSQPRGIAVYPYKGYLFWSQVNQPGAGSPAQILRSTLSGEDRKQIGTSNGRPTALSVDYKLDRIYWIDSNDHTVFSVDINGWESPKLLYSSLDSTLKGLAVYQGWIFVTEFDKDKILTINKTNGEVEHSIYASSPHGVSVVGGDSQPYFSGPCDVDNGGCEDFCFPQPPGNKRKCGCAIGLELSLNGTTCLPVTLKEDFFVVVDSDMHWIFQVSADGKKYARLDLPGIKVPVQVEFDPETKVIYWTDVGSASVNRANIDGTEFKVLAKDNVRQPTGLALDRMSGNLYWTDEGTGTINMIRVDGTHRKTLTHDVKSPRALAVDPFLGLMWWSDWTSKTIEMAHMDGSNRKVIVNKDIDWLNGIATDHAERKLYWCDAHDDVIYVSNLDGSRKQLFKTFDENVHMFGITLDEYYVYYTDWNDQSIMRVSKSNPTSAAEPFGPKIFNKLSDVHNFLGTGNVTDIQQLKHPCRVNNGDCTGLCVPVPSPKTSENEDALIRVCLCGAEHKGSCDKPQIVPNDTVPPSFNGTCPEDMVFTATPCQDFVFVNYTKPTAIDNSGRVVFSREPEHKPPTTLMEGKHEHVYVATDAAGNTDSCHFTITVNVIKCPSAHSYVKLFDNVKVVNSTCGNFYGSHVNLTCTNGTRIMITDFMTCDVKGEWQGEPICYQPSDADSNGNNDESDGTDEKNEVSTTAAPRTTTVNIATITEESHEDVKYEGKHVQNDSEEEGKKENYKKDSESSRPIPKDHKTSVTSHKVKTTESTMKTPTHSSHSTIRTSTNLNSIGFDGKKNFRGKEMEFIYLIIPVIIVIIVVIIAALAFRFCKNRSMPLLETMEKKLTFFNLREVDESRDTVAFGGDTIQHHRRSSLVTEMKEEPLYAEVDRDVLSVVPEITTVTVSRCASLPGDTVYTPPVLPINYDITSNNTTTVTTEEHPGYGTIG